MSVGKRSYVANSIVVEDLHMYFEVVRATRARLRSILLYMLRETYFRCQTFAATASHT